MNSKHITQILSASACALALIACGSSSDDGSAGSIDNGGADTGLSPEANAAKQALVGSWFAACEVDGENTSLQERNEFSASQLTYSQDTFLNNNCSGAPESTILFIADYDVGNANATSSNVGGFPIDLTLDDGSLVLSIFRIEQNNTVLLTGDSDGPKDSDGRDSSLAETPYMAGTPTPPIATPAPTNPCDVDSDGGRACATPISLLVNNTSDSITTNLSKADDVDFFSIDIGDGIDSLQITTSGAPGLDCYLTDSEGNYIDRSYSSGSNSYIDNCIIDDRRVPPNGTYFVQVSTTPSKFRDGEDYTLTVRGTRSGCSPQRDPDEDGDYECARSIELPFQTQGTLLIESAGDESDWYTFELTEPTKVSYAASSNSNDLVLYCQFQEYKENLITQACDSANSSTLNFDLTPGTYYFSVKSQNGVSGSYNVYINN
ncbi:MAG: PPC domain-containing protein [Oceanococcus sp.]